MAYQSKIFSYGFQGEAYMWASASFARVTRDHRSMTLWPPTIHVMN